jgi:putative membrane protein
MLSVFAEMMDHHDGGGRGHGLGWLIVIVVLLGLVAVVVWAVMRITTARHAASAPPSGASRSAEEILAERLARGEIDADEYRERLSALRGS